jgi:chromate transporter
MLPLGFLAYGGPMAHIGILRKKFVDDKEWIPDLEFTELFGLCQSMPGTS